MYGSPTLHENPSNSLRESWEYDSLGRLTGATGGGMRYGYTYYDNGLLKEKHASGRNLLAYTYDLSGSITSRRDLTGKEIHYGYDRCGRLKSVADNGRILAAYTYYSDGRVESRTIADTIRTDYRYDADKNLTYMKTVDMTIQGRKLVWEEYPAYDHNGNMVEKRNCEGTTGYGYDVNNQLVEVSYPGAGGLLSEKLSYDRAANRLTRERHTADSIIMETYHYDNCNHLKELNRRTYETDGVTPRLDAQASPMTANNLDVETRYVGKTDCYSHDRSGNLLSDGNAAYTYDGFGRTAEVRMANGNTQKNHYDAEGLRAEMEENGQLVKFLFNEDKEVIAEETSNDVIRYIRGLGIISSDSESARTYYHYVSDNQSSVRLILTDTINDRKIRNYYYYDAFGESVISHEDIHNRFRFNGEQYDPVTSQYYLRARYYNPVIGRFTQEDTYYGDGLNLYEYCKNNPILYRDPSGHDVCPAQLALYKLYRQYRQAGMTPQQAWNQIKNRVWPSCEPNILAQPGGKRTKINYSDPDVDNIRSLIRENEAADALARQGYVVEQNPNVPGSKNPDYLIEGEIFDCYSPKNGTSVRNIAGVIQRKIDAGQTNRIILNLDDWLGGGGKIDELITQLNNWSINGLIEVKIINQYHEVIDIYP